MRTQMDREWIRHQWAELEDLRDKFGQDANLLTTTRSAETQAAPLTLCSSPIESTKQEKNLWVNIANFETEFKTWMIKERQAAHSCTTRSMKVKMVQS